MATLVIIIGVYLAGGVLARVLSKQRVHVEAAHFWSGRAANPEYPVPSSANTVAYLVTPGQDPLKVPKEFRAYPPGLHALPDGNQILLVQDRQPGRLYLAMSFGLLNHVIHWMGLISAALALLAIYIATWVTYRSSKQLVIPINWLARQVSRWDPASPDVDAIAPRRIPGGGVEVGHLGRALRELSQRTHDYVRRERDFTRDASHELRTPLTVMRMGTDMLLSDNVVADRSRRTLERMQQAGRDMESVIEAFLVLARASDHAPAIEEFDVLDVVREEIGKVRALAQHKSLQLDLVEASSPRLRASPRVLAVMVGQLLDNAVAFTDSGCIEVRVQAECLVITDTGIGMTPDTREKAWDVFYRVDPFSSTGKGVGLSIVRRLGERIGWPVTLDSQPGVGTVATIRFAGNVVD